MLPGAGHGVYRADWEILVRRSPSTPPGARAQRGGRVPRRELWIARMLCLGLNVPLFEELSDPALVARLAAEAEESGWHGFFVWDQVRWREPVG